MITPRRARLRRMAIWLFLLVAVGPALLWGFLPREKIDATARFDIEAIGTDPEAYLAMREGAFDDITPGAEKSIRWVGEPGETSDIVLIYLHGFSATAEEIRPVPERLADEIGANLIFTRLAGHGRDGAAMVAGNVSDWMFDLDEALAIADRIGERTVLIGTSTGATLAILALAEGREAEGAILIAPNLKIANPLSAVLTFPAARSWVPPLFGRERSFEPQNEDHARYWTTTYPTEALFQMAALVEHVRGLDHAAIETPALFQFSDADTVVDHTATRAVAGAWGGPVTVNAVTLTPGDDSFNHVIAGDILSPGMTDSTVETFAGWIRDQLSTE